MGLGPLLDPPRARTSMGALHLNHPHQRMLIMLVEAIAMHFAVLPDLLPALLCRPGTKRKLPDALPHCPCGAGLCLTLQDENGRPHYACPSQVSSFRDSVAALLQPEEHACVLCCRAVCAVYVPMAPRP